VTVSALDQATLNAIRSSSMSAVTLVKNGDLDGARGAIQRAEKRFSELAERHPPHSRIVRQAREGIDSIKTLAPEKAGPSGPRSHLAARQRNRAKRACARMGT
jgi:hypothetical protein